MKIFKLMAIALVAMVGLNSCSKDCDHDFIEVDYSKDIVGTWTCMEAGFAQAFVFKADGTAITVGVENGEYWEDVQVNWKVENNKLILSHKDNVTETLLELIPGNLLSITGDKRRVYQYCANDLSEETLGMWVCNVATNEINIQTYKADGTTIATAVVPSVDSYMLNTETTYKVVGDLLFTKVADKLLAPDTEMYYASRLVYTPNGTNLGDIMTKMYYVSETQMVNYSWLRIKQSLELENKNYDYSNIYVTNVKGEDKDFEFAGQTLNFSTLDGSVMDKLMKHILFNVSFTSGKISYNCYYNGANKSIDAPIEVDGNKVTIKMSENNSVYRDVEMYMFQDAKNTQLHMYMPTKSFEKFFGNISVATMAKEGELDLNDASAVKAVFDNIENAIESINVSFIFKDPTRAL